MAAEGGYDRHDGAELVEMAAAVEGGGGGGSRTENGTFVLSSVAAVRLCGTAPARATILVQAPSQRAKCLEGDRSEMGRVCATRGRAGAPVLRAGGALGRGNGVRAGQDVRTGAVAAVLEAGWVDRRRE